MITPNYKITTK